MLLSGGVLIDPELKLGEAFIEGGLVVEQGSIADLLAIVLGQPYAGRLPHWARVQWLGRYLGRRLKQFNSPRRAQRNVAHHYDLDDASTGCSSTPISNIAVPISSTQANH